MIRSPRPKRQGFRGKATNNRAQGSNATYVLSVVANKLRATFVVPVIASGVPRILATGGAHVGSTYPTSYTQVSQLIVDFGYANNVAAGDIVTVPPNDQNVRTFNGGYMEPRAAAAI